jgi:ubiquinone/menaquinone biosynthesis C-methylase UbiE|tara:strand:+ start:15491 stop:16333 length:843 start_codon:yes stop_codon:yes gene_type:complete
MKNQDKSTVDGFGDEWSRFDQSDLPQAEQQLLFDEYFSVFPWKNISKESIGFDLGCGTGRWAKSVAPKVKKLICIDPSSALDIAKKNLSNFDNCVFDSATVDEMPMQDNSMDFGYSLGVLHHVPDTALGIKQCVKKLKIGAPLLLYLYYRFDNRPWWFRLIWFVTDLLRRIVSKMPYKLRYFSSQIISIIIYLPLARFALFLEKLNFNVSNFPLSSYKNLSFYTMRTDALDRFGTRLEQRFTRKEIKNMMQNAGLENIEFSDSKPFWVAVGYKSNKIEDF